MLLNTPLLLLTLFCKADTLQEYKLSGNGQGTTYHIAYYALNDAVKQPSIDSLLHVIDMSMSAYVPTSLVSKFNASAKSISIDKHFAAVAKKSLQVYKQSNGVFDITVAPLVQAWGFGPVKVDKQPAPGVIAAIMKHVGSDKIVLKNNYLYKLDSKVSIDLNGIAQGYTVDVIAQLLESHGIYNYMVELGGEIRLKGTKPSGDLFRIGIESPAKEANSDIVLDNVITLTNCAITTSGNYRKFHMAKGKKLSHLINPKTGYPLQNEMISATVIAKDGLTADAFDNVFMGMGIKRSFAYLKDHKGMEAYFIYRKPNGTIADTATTGFYKFIVKDKR